VHPGDADVMRGPPAGALAELDGLERLRQQWPITAD
jgi:hypothetical protein